MKSSIGEAISPLDGRYHATLGPVRSAFSEFALMRERVRVECEHVLALESTDVFPKLTREEKARLTPLLVRFDPSDYTTIKAIEATLRHDVKACEVFLRERLGLANPNRIHFGLTSEDVNNLAYSLCAQRYVAEAQLPSWKRVLSTLIDFAEKWADVAWPARTHGQHATPTTFGKELAVVVERLLRPYGELRAHRFRGKLNGATGNYSAFQSAAPGTDWRGYERAFVERLGCVQNLATTQIEDCDSIGTYLHITAQWNRVLVDFCQDTWTYISYGYLIQRTEAGEVGSSTMPHKVNPIHFENAEGNFQLSSALSDFLSDKLSRSRMQRDLSGSTIMRNLGVAIGHHHLACEEVLRGLGRIDVDADMCRAELQAHPELLAEPIQTILRTVQADDVYSALKAQTRGQSLSRKDLASFVRTLDVSPDVRERLEALAPETYVGQAPAIAREIVIRARGLL